MPNRSSSSHAIDTLAEVLIERLEIAHELGVAASSTDIARERQRWLGLHNAGNDIAALARAMEILSRRN
jgi:hypothetical protein